MEEKQSESDLLERVFLRLGYTDTDEKLEEFVKRFLTPVLLKLSSHDEDVKKKILELLAHINRRLKNRERVQLPMDSLFVQYQDPQCSPYVRNFTILYLKMSFTRLDPDKQLHYLPQIFLCMKEKPKPQQDCLLQMAMPVLSLLNSDKMVTVMKELHSIIGKDTSISELFLSFVLDVLLVPYSVFSSEVTDVKNMPVPPGLSRSALQQNLSGHLTLENLEKVKLGIVRFLAAGFFESSAVQVHLVVAIGDSRHSVSEYGENQLKMITEASDWEHACVVSKLMSICLGSISLPGKQPALSDDVRIPASLSLRLKIFPFLLKSRKSADVFPACLQLVFQSLHGKISNKKLKVFSVQFIHHLCECSSDKVMAVVSPVLLSTLLKLTAKNEETSLRKITYLAIGKISKRAPSLCQKDSAVIQNLFDALRCEDPETGLAVMQSLTMVATASKDASPPTLALIEALILSNITQDHHHCRLAALQVANILFPTNHVKSRYACLIASADARDDIREEANKGLLFNRATDNETGKVLPDFTTMLTYIHQTVHGTSGYTQGYVTVAGSLIYSPSVFIKVLSYLKQCLKSSAGVTKDDEVNDQALVPIKRYIQYILTTQPTVVSQYLSLIQEALKQVGTSHELHSLALISLLELLVSAPSKLAPALNQNGTTWIKNFIWSSQDVIRHTSSHVLAILACLLGNNVVLIEIKQLLDSIKSSSEAIQHGTVVCCGHLIGHYFAQQNRADSLDDMKVHDLEEAAVSDIHLQEVITDAFKAIVGFLGNSSSLLVHAACDAIAEVCRHGSIPLPDGTPLCDEEKLNQATNKAPSAESETKLNIVHQLAEIMNNSKEPKLSEKAALILGLMCVGDQYFPHCKSAVEKLLDASKKREIDMQFTIGEALSCAGAGKFSTASTSKWYTGERVSEEAPETKDTMRWLLCKIFNEYISSDVAHIRKAACIWLLVILKHASKHSVVQEMLGEIQQAFSAMLSENDELVQEVASKGLSLVYEFGSEEFRSSMVSSLVNTMLAGKKPIQNVTADTKLFDQGALGRAPGDTSQLSTYKELCSLANDMNRPELVYRFLHLANHNAMWNSKKGAAFGFASIGVQAKKELEAHLKTLVPKLYRYQFDPNIKVREAMLSIWGAIVKDPRKIIDQYSQEILNELLGNLHDPMWRVRQSCCIAVSNFLNGRSLDSVINDLPQLWSMCLRDMDDIKETVRKAAEIACKTLQNVSVRLCDVNQGKIGQEAVRLLLPVLLEQGLCTKVKEVRSLSLQTIVKISKNAGSLLKPHIPVLVSALLESLSGLEQQALNYVSLQVQNDPDIQGKLEDIRIASSKSSPMMETITLCVQHIDSTVLPKLVPRLTDLLRSGLGLGTKAGSAGFVVSLVQQCGQELQPYAGKLLSALLSGMTDRSQSVCRKYADAIGQLARVAKDSSISKLFVKMKAWYLEKEDDTIQEACGLVCYAIARSSRDVISHHAVTILPLAFVAMHRKSDNNGKKSPWEEIWSENTPGTTRGIQLYLEEIITITSSMLSDQSWQRKVEAALSIQTLVSVMHTSLPKSSLDSLASVLVSSLSGRTWDGKENVVSCLASLCSKCYELLDETTVQEIIVAILKECQKEKLSYKATAIKCLGQILQKKKHHDFKGVFDILKPIVDPDDDKVNSKESDEEQTPSASLLINAFECIGLAWPDDRQQQILHREKVLSILVKALKKNTWKIQLAILESLKIFINAVSAAEETAEDFNFMQKLVLIVLPEICQCLGNVKYVGIRLKSLEVARCVVSVIQGSSRTTEEQISLMKELAGKLSILKNDKNTNVKEKAIELKSMVDKEITTLLGGQ